MWKSLIFGKHNVFARPFMPLMFADSNGGSEEDESEPFTDDKMNDFMSKKFPVEDKPVDNEEQEDKPKPKEEPKPDPKPAPKAKEDEKIPPGFDPNNPENEAKPDENEEEDDPDLSDLDAEIEKETNDDKKINLGRFRTKLSKQEQTIQAQSKVLEDLRAAGVLDEQNTIVGGADPDTQKKLTEAYDTIGKLSLAHDPRFQQKYDSKMSESVMEVAAIIAGDSQDEAEIEQAKQLAWQAANMNQTQRMALIEEHAPDHMKMTIALAYRDFDKTASERSKALQSHKEASEQINNEQMIRTQREAQDLRDAITNKVAADLEREGFLAKKPGNDIYNTFVDKLHSETQEIIASNDVNIQARAMMLGPQAVVYRTMYEKAQTALNEANKELAKFKDAKVRIRGGNNNDIDPKTDLSNLSVKELAAHVAGQSNDAE